MKPGQAVDQFVIKKKLAAGGVGDVYLAEDTVSRAPVALKFLRLPEEEKDSHDRVIEEFKREYQIVSTLSHPNVAKVRGFGYHEGRFYFATEYVEGEHIYNATVGKPYERRVDFYIQLLDGLDFLHRHGILHLDIKPSNVLVTEVDGRPLVKIVDFGLATAVTEYKGLRGGSIDYIAPEVVLEEGVDCRADLFSAGVLMYQCTVGDFPFDRYGAKGNLGKLKEIVRKSGVPSDPLQWNRSLPPHLITIIMRLLAKNPDERFYTNARAVINALLTHAPDVFAGVGGNYLIPPADEYIGQDGKISEIEGLFREEKGESRAYVCIGGRGLGKSYFLECIRNRAELKAERWYVSKISLPASSVEAEAWLKNLQAELAKGRRGVAVLIDNLGELSLCDSNTREKIENLIMNLVESISERAKRPEIFEEIPPVILICTSNSLLPLCKGELEGVENVIHLRPFTCDQSKGSSQ